MRDDDDRDEDVRARLMATRATVPTASLARLWRAGRGALGVTRVLRRWQRGGAPDSAQVAEIVATLGGLKGVAMKAGQMLSYVHQTLPPELRDALAVLQTAAPAMDFDTLTSVVRAALGERAEALLAGLVRAPIAVASIGQVHRGQLPDGTAVAVKVRHPDIRAALTADFRSAAAGSTLAILAGGATVADTIDEARNAFLEECDYELEAARQTRFGQLFADDPVIAVPAVERAFCGDGVLVTRYRPGRSLDEFLRGSPAQAERDRAGEALFRFWLRTLYRDGLFHGDPHPGNFAFADDGRVVLYDFGCVREFGPALRVGFARLAAATRDDDLDAIVAALESIGGRAPRDAEGRAHLRRLVRGFFGPLLAPGARRVARDEGLDARRVLADKRRLLGLRLPARMLFLFRLRFGLYAVLSRLEACVDWAGLEGEWAAQARFDVR